MALGQLAEAGRFVHRPADDGVLVAAAGSNRAGDDQTGRNADADVEPDPVGTNGAQVVAEDPSRPQRPAGMVRQLTGSTKDTEGGVTLELVDKAELTVDDLDNRVVELVEDDDELVGRDHL